MTQGVMRRTMPLQRTAATVTVEPSDDDAAVRLRAADRIRYAAVARTDVPLPEPAAFVVHLVVRDDANAASASGGLVAHDDRIFEIRGFARAADTEAMPIGAGHTLLRALEVAASELGARALLFETAPQLAAELELFSSRGYRRIDNWGPYHGATTSICVALRVS